MKHLNSFFANASHFELSCWIQHYSKHNDSELVCTLLQIPWILPVTFVLVCAFLVVFGAIAQPMDTLIGFAISLSGIPIYFVGIYWENKPAWMLNFIGNSHLFYCEGLGKRWAAENLI